MAGLGDPRGQSRGRPLLQGLSGRCRGLRLAFSALPSQSRAALPAPWAAQENPLLFVASGTLTAKCPVLCSGPLTVCPILSCRDVGLQPLHLPHLVTLKDERAFRVGRFRHGGELR